jgi:uncharacterized protein (TIGR00255 family)
MTGFGRTVLELSNKKVNIELKSLNSKQLDLSIKMPGVYKSYEMELRSLLSKEVSRGKMELSIYVEKLHEESKTSINQELALTYKAQLKTLAENIGQPDTNLMEHILRMPDVMKTTREEVNVDEWKEISVGINSTISAFNNFRETEGQKLYEDFELRINSILSLLSKIENFEGERIEIVKERLTNHLENAVGKDNIDNNRFEQELIYFLEKYDITEEKVRLKAHCEYFMSTANETDNQGKKIGFITQEIGREVNTIGSKSNHVEMQQLVVQMKDELEKIKEQALNVL